MAEKKKPANKTEKAPVSNKIDWSKQPNEVVIVALTDKHMKKGNEYTVGKENAQILIEKGAAKLK